MAVASQSLVIPQGDEFSATALRRTKPCDGDIIPIPTGFEARMRFATQFGTPVNVFTLTSSPPAGLTIDYANGSIAIYYGATQTALLTPKEALAWQLEIYDPLNADTVVLLGKGTAYVDPAVV